MSLASAAVGWLMSQDSCQLPKALEVFGSRSQYVCVLFYSTQMLCLEIYLLKKKIPAKVFSLQDISFAESAFALTSIALQKPSSCFSVTYINIYNCLSKAHGYLASCNICLCTEPICFFFFLTRPWSSELPTFMLV